MTRAMSQGKQALGAEVDGKESRQQMMEPSRRLPGTGEVAERVSREGERLKMLEECDTEDAGTFFHFKLFLIPFQ